MMCEGSEVVMLHFKVLLHHSLAGIDKFWPFWLCLLWYFYTVIICFSWVKVNVKLSLCMS